MIKFEVNQENGKKIPVNFWRRILTKIEKLAKIDLNKRIKALKLDLDRSEISIAVIGDAAMKKLNGRYRGLNKVTDVLSFSSLDQKEKAVKSSSDYLGEVIICYPQLLRQAKAAKKSLNSELELLLTHGFLHLLGLDHEKNKTEARIMAEFQEKVIKTKK